MDFKRNGKKMVLGVAPWDGQKMVKKWFWVWLKGMVKKWSKNGLGVAERNGQKIIKKWFGVDSPPPPDGCSRNGQSGAHRAAAAEGRRCSVGGAAPSALTFLEHPSGGGGDSTPNHFLPIC